MHDLGWLSSQTVYNLNVSGQHTYIVGGNDGVLVHNSTCWVGDAVPKRVKGVYEIHLHDGKVYVGKSRDIHKRIHQHSHKNGKLKKLGYEAKHVTEIRHQAIRGSAARSRAEQSLINHYGGIRQNGRLLNLMNAMRF